MSVQHRVARSRVATATVGLLAGATVVVATERATAVTPAPVVDSTTSVLDADSGNGDGVTSLADAVWLANGDTEADTITFDLDPADLGPIDAVNVPQITEDLTIVGPGRSRLTVTDSSGDVLYVAGTSAFALSDITIDGSAAGFGPFDGLTLDGAGDVVLERVDVANVSNGISASQPGADPSGSFTADDVEVSNPTSIGISLLRVADVTLDDVDVSSTGGGSGISILDGGDVTITGGSVAEAFDGLRIRNVGDVSIDGFAAADNDDRGIVLREVYGTSVLDGVVVEGNSGVGVRVDAAGASPPVGEDDVRDVSILAAFVDGNAGGGISIAEAGDVTISDSQVAGNGTAPTTGDGGVRFGLDNTPSLATIERTTISGNFGDSTGGVGASDYAGEIRIVDSEISGNQANSAKALRLEASGGGGPVTLTRTVVSGHTAGASSVIGVDDVTIRLVDSVVTGNSAEALFLAENNGEVAVNNSTVTANTFTGALFRIGSAGNVEAVETTATGNTGTAGSSGIFDRVDAGGQLVARNSVLSGNGVPLAAPGNFPPAPTVAYSVVPTGSPAGTGNVVADDPGLGPLTDNGGPTSTMLPTETSPAVDAGDPSGPVSATTTDQRGLARVVGGRIDIGSVERQQSPFVVGLPPARVLETRNGPGEETIDGQFEGIGRRPDGGELTLPVAGRAGVPVDAEAVVVNVTAVRPSGVGFVTVHPCLVNPPLASSLNFRADVDSGNEIVAELDETGSICLFNRTDTHLVVDVVGYVPAGSRYTTVGPARLLDTRDFGVTIDGQFQQGGIRGSDTELALDVAGRGGVSDTAVAVVVNVTAVKPVNIGYVTVHPCLPQEPTAASLNFEPGVNRGNEIIAQLDDQGRICLYTFGSAQLVVDVVGQLSDENVYEPVPPARLLETRTLPTGTIDGQQEAIGRRGEGSTTTVRAAGRAGVPGNADAVVVNVTAIRPDLRGFITVWDCVGPMPLAASLNYITDEIVGNELVVALDGGEFCVFTSRATDVTVDVVAHLS